MPQGREAEPRERRHVKKEGRGEGAGLEVGDVELAQSPLCAVDISRIGGGSPELIRAKDPTWCFLFGLVLGLNPGALHY